MRRVSGCWSRPGSEPESAEILRHLVVEAMLAHQNERALQAAIGSAAGQSQLRRPYLVSTVMVQQKQYVPATHILEDYVASARRTPRPILVGMAYLSLLRYADAQQALNRSRQLNPNLAETEYQLGLLASQQGNREDAIQHWQKLSSYDRTTPKLFSAWARCFWKRESSPRLRVLLSNHWRRSDEHEDRVRPVPGPEQAGEVRASEATSRTLSKNAGTRARDQRQFSHATKLKSLKAHPRGSL